MSEVPSWGGDAMALAAALVWAVAVLLLRRLRAVDPASVNLFKNTLATFLLAATMLATGRGVRTDRPAGEWAALLVSGVLGLALADTLFLAGLRRLESSVAAVTDCAYSPTVIVLSWLLLGERLRASLWVGAPLVIVGLLFVTWRTADGARTRVPVDPTGVALALAGVATTALGVVIAKPALDKSDLIEATTIRLVAGTLALALAQLALGRRRAAFELFRPGPAWRAAIPATVLGSYVGMVLWLGGMKYGTASRAALLNQMGAIFVIVLSRLSGEVVPLRRWIGVAVAVAGVCVIVAT